MSNNLADISYNEFCDKLEDDINVFLSSKDNKVKYPFLYLYLKYKNGEDIVAIIHSLRNLRGRK